MADDRHDRLERHYESLLEQYGAIRIEQASMNRIIEERTASSGDRAKRFEDALRKLDAEKAESTALDAVIVELRGIKRLLTGLLVSIVLASVGFGFAALQIAGTHP